MKCSTPCILILSPILCGSIIILPVFTFFFFFFQAEDGIRDIGVTGVQTCALPISSLNRAVFWFSPFAWWQLIRIAELAEIISDARALEVFEDRLSYAEILLDLVQDRKSVV